MSKKLDLIVFGATGFTGRLVAEYLNRQYGADGSVRWAMAGRSLAKLEEVRDLIQVPNSVPLLTANATDPAALRQLVAGTRAVITTVGPYQLHGEPLLQACVDTGCDYLDLCGEPAWMAQMIHRHHAAAQASGARIVFSSGFDSVPFDLGVRFLQHHAMERDGQPLRQVQGRVMVMKGGFSGGTAASLVETMAAMGRDPEAARAMANPFALTPGFNGPPQPDLHQAQLDDFTNAWSAPFVMAPINTKNVHRSNALLGHLYGQDFVYEERMSCGPGRSGELRARGMVRTETIQNALLGFGPTRALLQRFALPKPGTGPGPNARETGRYEVLFSGVSAHGRRLSALVAGDRDPGYGSTSKIISECALALVQDISRKTTPGGVWTPGAALGMAVVPRLQARSGLYFTLRPEAD
jgi:short subunit dehydrogenase-like uncharacterized protein